MSAIPHDAPRLDRIGRYNAANQNSMAGCLKPITSQQPAIKASEWITTAFVTSSMIWQADLEETTALR